MVTLTGTLFIRTLHGRHGAFSVGRLLTDIGTFAVKDSLLDQYAAGQYAGVFDIARIYPAAYVQQGQLVIETRARLAGMTLAAIDSLPERWAQDIPADPIEPTLSPPEEAAEPDAPPPAAPENEATGLGGPPEQAEVCADARLFGALWPLAAAFKLDTTVDRALLRQQRDRLKALGYGFDAKTQTWSMLEEAWLMPA